VKDMPATSFMNPYRSQSKPGDYDEENEEGEWLRRSFFKSFSERNDLYYNVYNL